MTSSHSLAVRHPDSILRGRAIHAGSLLTIVLVFLFAANVYDTAGALGIKHVAFFLLCVSAVRTLKYVDFSSLEVIGGMLLFVVWPCWALLFGAVRKGDMLVGASQVTPFLFGLVLAAVLCAFDTRIPLRLFYACLFSLAIVVLASFALVYLLPDNPFSSALFAVLTSRHEKEGYFGMQSLGGVEVPIIYFGSTLFLVPTFVYYLFVGRMLRAGIVFLAIEVTFSKAGIIIALVFSALYSASVLFGRSSPAVREGVRALVGRRLRKFLPIVIIGAIASGFFLSFPALSDEIRDALSGESDTILVRIGHFQSVMNLFRQHPSYLVIGQGVGVPFYSLGESTYVQNFEIDQLNAIRKFGLPWFIGFSAVVFYSAYKLIRKRRIEERAFGCALISIYFAAGTNPVLISPLFIIVMMLSYFAQKGQLERPSQCSASDLQRV
jgi:hypothetical protein